MVKEAGVENQSAEDIFDIYLFERHFAPLVTELDLSIMHQF